MGYSSDDQPRKGCRNQPPDLSDRVVDIFKDTSQVGGVDTAFANGHGIKVRSRNGDSLLSRSEISAGVGATSGTRVVGRINRIPTVCRGVPLVLTGPSSWGMNHTTVVLARFRTTPLEAKTVGRKGPVALLKSEERSAPLRSLRSSFL